MGKVALVFVMILSFPVVFGQDKKIDRLEIFYDQGYYRKVLHKSRKLLANPEYDYSTLPEFYEALSLFRLAGEDYWLKRHSTAIDDAIKAYREFLDSEKEPDYVNQHYFEIVNLKVYLTDLAAHFEEQGWEGSGNKLRDFLAKELGDIEGRPIVQQPRDETDQQNPPPIELTNRDKIVAYAKQYLGVKYKWAGMDEHGFDCSGFTSYVYRKFGILLPRSASGQEADAKKVKITAAQKGDLVFFGPGVNITHVGLVVSEKGDELTMIHASTSKGVILTNVMQSTYWNPKLKAAGTYL